MPPLSVGDPRPGLRKIAGAAACLFSTKIVGGAVGNQIDRQFDVARDGRFLLNVELEVAAPPITVIQNWSPEASK